MVRRMIIMLIAVGLVFAGIFGFQKFRAQKIHEAMAAMGNAPQTISTVTAKTARWPSSLDAVGTVRAINGANLSFQVAGIVSAIHFKSGADVAENAPLIDLEASDDIAHLQALQATMDLAKSNFARDSKLTSDAITAQALETDRMTLQNDEAQVAQQQVLVSYKRLHAPFAGRLGIRQVDLGQFVAASAPVVALQQLDPIFVDFFLPQQKLGKLEVGQKATATLDSGAQTFTGRLTAINSLVDSATRNVKVRAQFENPKHVLLPGMFVRVDINVGEPQPHVILPQTAIAYNSYGDIVYLIERRGGSANGRPQLFVRQTFVTTGPTRGDQVAVLSGVKDGDVVASAGQVKLRDGAPVVVSNKVEPLDNPHPTPPDE